MDAFQRLLPELVAQYGGTKQDLARAIGITPSTLSHMLKPGASPPGVEVCLRLAAETGVSASKVLRAAGKAAVADLIEDLYGAVALRRQPFVVGQRLTPIEQKHLADMRALDRKTQRAVFVIVDAALSSRATRALLFPAKDVAAGEG